MSTPYRRRCNFGSMFASRHQSPMPPDCGNRQWLGEASVTYLNLEQRVVRRNMLLRFRNSVVAILVGAIWTASTGAAHAVGRCSATATVNWEVSPERSLTIEGLSDGPDCTSAVVVIVIRAPSGDTLWVDASAAASIMTFMDVSPTNVVAMKTALEEWIGGASSMRQTNALPDWPEGAVGPSTKLWSPNDKSGFAFQPESGIDRNAYLEMRHTQLPLFCYVMGMESLACVVLTPDGSMTKVGVQSFPG